MSKVDPSSDDPTNSRSITIWELAEEYLTQLRSGEPADIEDLAKRYPELATEIRETLPALVAIEQFGIELGNSHAEATPGWTAPQVEQVGDYRILAELGRGGMGVVYEAEQQSLRRRVALKVLPRMASDESGLARFQREARAAARLHHSNIVPVFQVGQDGGHAYYAMQLIEGRGLDAVIKDLRRMPMQVAGAEQIQELQDLSQASGSSPSLRFDRSEVLQGLAKGQNQGNDPTSFHRSVAQIGMQASDALAYAHDRGIVHRDVKPSNLLLDGSGVVWVSDFGLAMTGEGQLTRTEDVLGTIRYMSPERFLHQCDARADIYALGITLYELLVLEPAFQMVNRLNLIRSIMNDDPPAPRRLDARIPSDLETIILKAIEKEPRDRYQTASDMKEDLRRFLNDDPIEARRARPLEKLIRWGRRNRSLASALSAVIALVALLLIVLSWTSFSQNELRQLAEDRGDKLQENLYFSQMNVAGHAASQQFGTESIAAELAEWETNRVGRDLRNWEWYYLYGLSHGAEFVSEPLGNGFCWSCDHNPDGTKVVNTKNGWGVQVRDARTGKILREQFLGSARFVDWSPDGTRIAVGQFGPTCLVLDAETLQIDRTISVPSGSEGRCVCWHPNSTWLAEISENEDPQKKSEVRIHHVGTGRQIHVLQLPDLSPRFLSWNHDGSRLAASGSGKTGIWSFANGMPEFEREVSGDMATWSPDGSMLAVNRIGGVWDAIVEKQLTDSNGSICWGPDSKRLAIGCNDGVVRIHNLESTGTHAQRLLRGHQSEIWSVSWHPNGQWLASCGLRDETLRTWKLSESDHLDSFGLTPRVYLPELSLDGTRIVSSAEFHVWIYLWNLNGKLLRQKMFGDSIRFVAPNSDGSTIAVCTEVPSLSLWNTALDSVVEISQNRAISGVSWNTTGQLAGAMVSGKIIIWDADGGVLLEIKRAHSSVAGVHWSPSGNHIASRGFDNSIKLWDSRSGRLLRQVNDLPSLAREIRFSHDGRRLATTHKNRILIWDVANGDRLDTFEQIKEDFRSLDWSQDDSRIVTGSQTSVAIWDVASGRLALRLGAPQRLTKVRWTPGGMRIIAGGERIKIYDASRGYALNESD